MLKDFEVLNHFKKGKSPIIIDGLYFRLFHRLTCAILCVSSLLIICAQYKGEMISCHAGNSAKTKFMNTYCFWNGTFTVSDRKIDNTGLPYPGVGHYDANEEVVTDHKYYQWVPWFLIILAFFCYLPHVIWKSVEGGILENTVMELEYGQVNYKEELEVFDRTITPSDECAGNLIEILDFIWDSIRLKKTWGYRYLLCEFMNVVFLVVQIFLTDAFLAKQFLILGYDMIFSSEKVLNKVFPKMAKCTLHSYGPTGTIQIHDAICVLSMNHITYIIFPIMWFCYLFLIIATVVNFLQMVICLCLYSRSMKFNKFKFAFLYPTTVNEESIKLLNKKLGFGGWIFLVHISRNMDFFIFNEVFDLAAMKISRGDGVSTGQEQDQEEQEPRPILRRPRRYVAETGL